RGQLGGEETLLAPASLRQQATDDVLGIRIVGRGVDDAAAALEEEAGYVLQRFVLRRVQGHLVASRSAGADHRHGFAGRRDRPGEHRAGERGRRGGAGTRGGGRSAVAAASGKRCERKAGGGER